jgi:hypothetical protein
MIAVRCSEEEPVIEGQLKEKKGGKWKIFKKWKSRYFTLSGRSVLLLRMSVDFMGIVVNSN